MIFVTVGPAALQCGHWKSRNSIIVTGASFGPFWGESPIGTVETLSGSEAPWKQRTVINRTVNNCFFHHMFSLSDKKGGTSISCPALWVYILMWRFSLRKDPEILYAYLEPDYRKRDKGKGHDKLPHGREVAEPGCGLVPVNAEDRDIEPVQKYAGYNQYVNKKKTLYSLSHFLHRKQYDRDRQRLRPSQGDTCWPPCFR